MIKKVLLPKRRKTEDNKKSLMISDGNVISLIQRELPTCKGGDESKFLFLRRKILVTGVKSNLEIKLQEIRKYYSDWEYIEIGIKQDHVHLYIIIPLKYTISKVVEIIKKNTGKSLIIKFNFSKKVYWDKKGIWGKGYFVSTVGINEEMIRKYVHTKLKKRQDKHSLSFKHTTPVKVWKSM